MTGVEWLPNPTATRRHAVLDGQTLCGREVTSTVVLGDLPKCKSCEKEIENMASKKKPAPVIPFGHIERRFTLMWLGDHPPVSKRPEGGYAIRILAGITTRGGSSTTKFDYFHLADDGTITEAPRGYAKDYRPGRIEPAELDAAVASYATEG